MPTAVSSVSEKDNEKSAERKASETCESNTITMHPRFVVLIVYQLWCLVETSLPQGDVGNKW